MVVVAAVAVAAAAAAGTNIRGPYQAQAGRAGGSTRRQRKAADLARPKFNFEKQQKDLAKKRKQEQKRLLKQARKNAGSTAPSSAEPHDASEST